MTIALASAEAKVIAWTSMLACSASLFALLTARWLGASDRGVVVVFLTTSSFFMLVGSLGVGTGGRVLSHRDPPLDLRTYLRHARVLSSFHLLTSATAGLAVLGLSQGLSPRWIAFFFVPYAVVLLFSYLAREALHGLGHHGSALLSDVTPAVTQVVTVVILHAVGRLTLFTTFVALAIGALTQSGYLIWRLRRVERTARNAAWPLGKVIRFSLPAMLTALGQAFVIRGDRLILGAIAGTAAVGVYGVAATFTEVLWLVPGAVGQVSFRRASVTNTRLTGALIRRLTLLLTVALALALAAAAPWLIPTLLGPGYGAAVTLSYVLIAAALPMASYQLDVAVLNGLGRLASSGRIALLGGVTLAIGCIGSIPTWGAYGAAWSSLVAYASMAVAAKYFLRRAEVQRRSL